MSDKPGFEIYKTHYPVPERFRLGDPVLVREITGMDWPEFVEALERMEAEDSVDQVVLVGLMAVAFWQGNPTMTRDKVRRVIERVWQEDAEVVGMDDNEDDVSVGDVVPPAEGGVMPPSSATGSNGTQDASSDTTNQNDSGVQSLVTGAPV